MKKEIKNKIKEVLYIVVYLVFTFSGWIFYIMSDIQESEKETDIIMQEAGTVKDSVTKVVTGPERYEVSRKYLDFVDMLIKDNKELQDSLAYYQTFYRLIGKTLDFDYEFTQEDSADYRINSGVLVNRGLRNGNPDSCISRCDSVPDVCANDTSTVNINFMDYE